MTGDANDGRSHNPPDDAARTEESPAAPSPSQRTPPSALTRLARLLLPSAGAKAPSSERMPVAEPVSVHVPPSFFSLEARPSALPPPVSEPSSLTPSGVGPLWSGRIRAGEEVGRGATGSVLRGTDTKLRRELALKVTTVPRGDLPTELLARFVEEAQITAQLEHPNVVPVHDMGIDPEGRAYFSMKLVRGSSLEKILEKRKAGDPATLSEFGLRRLLDVFLQVCQAVEYAHARGVIHRDLKPANIMVGDFGEVLVMDWGVAKVTGRPDHPTPTGPETPRSSATELLNDVTSVRAGNRALATQHGALLGTPAYMSPEQARGMHVDERADFYALGVILYEILCGEVPFDADDANKLLVRLLTEKPRPPSQIDPTTPIALEVLVLRLLEKEPERRSISIHQIRSRVQDYIEGIGHEYRRESLWTNALWLVGALGLFAFLVWYLTGQSVAAVIALTPPLVFNALGWLLVVIAVGYPLWGATSTFRTSRIDHDHFRPPTSAEVFASGYLAHRTLAVAIAPLFQLVFVVEVFAAALPHAARGLMRPQELAQQIGVQLRAGWANALVIILLFLFAYLFLLSSEVRFARRIDRYLPLVRRPKWESAWPFFLIVVVVSTIIATDFLDWTPAGSSANAWAYVRERVLTKRLPLFEIVKTLVFQGTFLVGLVATTLGLAFPFSELLAALRMAYQPADDASVSSRHQYFLRSMAVFQIAKANWQYAGAMIGSLTAVTILSHEPRAPLVEQLLYVLGPAALGFLGFSLTRRHTRAHLAAAPAVRRMLQEQVAASRDEQTRANLEQIRSVSWRPRLLQVAVPIVCIVAYLAWTGSGVHRHAIRQLIVPVSTKGWLLILPYVLLVPLLLVRDHVQLWLVRLTLRR
jgi:serine/threonine protein kinase